MKVTKEIKNLVNELNKQTLIVEQARARMEELRGQLLGIMLEEGVKSLETPFGKANVIQSKTYDFSEYSELSTTKALYDSLRAKAQETAPFVENSTLRFNPNRAYEVPEVTLTRVWKKTIVLNKEKELAKA